MSTPTVQDWTYSLASAEKAALNFAQMEDFLSSPTMLLSEKKNLKGDGGQTKCLL